MKYLVLILSLILISCGTSQDEELVVCNPDEFCSILLSDLPKIKNYVLELEPKIGQTNDITTKARLISNFIYNHIPLTQNNENLSYYTPYTSLVQMGSNICLGISIFYRYVLMAFDIESRYVALFMDITEPDYSSHATTEFFDGEKWVASDATFNLVWVNEEGALLSYEEVFYKRLNSKFYSYQYNSSSLVTDRTFEYHNQYYDTDDYFNYLAIYPSNDSDSHVYLSVQGEWDGYVYPPWLNGGQQYMNISQNKLFIQINKAFLQKYHGG